MKLSRRPASSAVPRRAFEELLAEHLDVLYSSALRFCAGRAADAEDLLQDAVFRAYQHCDDLRDPGAARAWLFTILTRTNLNRLRSQRRRSETLAQDLEEEEFENALAAWQPCKLPDELLETTLDRDRITAALDSLDEDLRSVIWLSDVEEFRQREIAEFLSIPEGTVASRLFRARQAMRAKLTRRWPQAYERSARE